MIRLKDNLKTIASLALLSLCCISLQTCRTSTTTIERHSVSDPIRYFEDLPDNESSAPLVLTVPLVDEMLDE